ncbi:MAG TPA: molybdenum cofactor cytidylyltransferase [Ktedonobacterales bacterium]|jgi:molybdenum cofactor cytidylyltransferase|nr:molybdenum cofactor cytidylyltransferase [Ktedonobacterales bacterium]
MAQEQRSVAAIILAAGRSSRMGSHKLLLPYKGRPIVNWVLVAACASQTDPVIIVLGHEAQQVDAALQAERWFLAIHNPWYADGMSTSLRIGLAATPKNADGAIILLGDQPLITPEIIDAMIAESARDPDVIIAASYQGRRGNPVLFPRQYFGELEAITGDEGGRSVLARHPEQVRLVEIDDALAGFDVDTPEEYQTLVSEDALDPDGD